MWIGEFAENGWIVPIDKFTSDASITDPNLNLKGFFPLLLDAFGSWGGKVYGLPFDNYSGLLFYNKCMLKDAGFDKPPATWDELLKTYAPKLTHPDKKEYAFALHGADAVPPDRGAAPARAGDTTTDGHSRDVALDVAGVAGHLAGANGAAGTPGVLRCV